VKSRRKPGLAETMGAGAAAGHPAVSAAVSSGLAFASEEFSANVDADAERTANQNNPGGHELAVFLGLAKPVKTPLMGTPRQP